LPGLAVPHLAFSAGDLVKFLSGFLQGGALGDYHRHEFVPGFDERSSAFVLEFRGQSVAIDSGLAEPGQNRFAIPNSAKYIGLSKAKHCYALQIDPIGK
jgi:hypothetical protein